jgi:hypothetical protein
MDEDRSSGAIEDELVGDDTAAEVLEVAADRIDALVDEGVLTPVEAEPRRFRRSDVVAVRSLGG